MPVLELAASDAGHGTDADLGVAASRALSCHGRRSTLTADGGNDGDSGLCDKHGPVARRFPYAVDYRFLPLWAAFGVRPWKDGVTLTDDGTLRATFGLLQVETGLGNVDGAHVTRGYRWWTAVGARMSLVDDGLTFGTNRDAGVCIHFEQKVRSALRPAGHSALTVTVADLDGLVGALGG